MLAHWNGCFKVGCSGYLSASLFSPGVLTICCYNLVNFCARWVLLILVDWSSSLHVIKYIVSIRYAETSINTSKKKKTFHWNGVFIWVRHWRSVSLNGEDETDNIVPASVQCDFFWKTKQASSFGMGYSRVWDQALGSGCVLGLRGTEHFYMVSNKVQVKRKNCNEAWLCPTWEISHPPYQDHKSEGIAPEAHRSEFCVIVWQYQSQRRCLARIHFLCTSFIDSFTIDSHGIYCPGSTENYCDCLSVGIPAPFLVEQVLPKCPKCGNWLSTSHCPQMSKITK